MKKIKQILLVLLLCFITIIGSGCSMNNIKNVSQLKGKKIGIVMATIYEDTVYDIVENPEVYIYNNPADMISALLRQEIDAFIYDDIVSNYYTNSNKFVNYINLNDYKYDSGYLLTKDEKHEKILDELNEYINEVKINNELLLLQTKWSSDDNSVKQAKDFSTLTGTKGTLKIVANSDCAPMSYLEGGKIIGYDLDVMYDFCKKKGYKATVEMNDFNVNIEKIKNGEADIAIGNIFITPERKEIYLITNSVFTSYASVGVYYDPTKFDNKKTYNKISDLKYKTIGVLEGTIYDNVAIDHIDGCKLRYYSTNDDLYNALDKGEVDGIIFDEPLARHKLIKNDQFKMLDRLITYDEYGVIFNKDSKFANTLRNQYNEFLIEIKNNGELEEIDSTWFGKNYSYKNIDYESLPNVNGRVRMCVTAEIGEPFAYIYNGKIVGYDVDMMYRFCKKYGYALTISNVSFTKIFDAIINNEFDLSACCISITEERKKLVNYSDPNYLGGLVCVVKK